jgi:hypothetical protein
LIITTLDKGLGLASLALACIIALVVAVDFKIENIEKLARGMRTQSHLLLVPLLEELLVGYKKASLSQRDVQIDIQGHLRMHSPELV